MPIYAYKCPECGLKFERIVSTVAEGDSLVCSGCGNTEPKKEITAAALHMRYSPMHPRYMRGQRT